MVEKYVQLLATYRRMFSMVDAFHFNSQNTAEVYGRYVNVPKESKVIPITHSGIKDHRKKKTFDAAMLHLGFIGSEAPFKGLPMLKEVIKRLGREGYSKQISLEVWGGKTGIELDSPNIIYKGHFTSAMMESVFQGMDLLVVPSIWYETFSLVALEALSYGVPVLVSDKVGAKDIVVQYDTHFVFKTKEDLYTILKRLVDDKTELIRYNEAIISSPWHWSMEQHAKEIVETIYS